MSPIFWYGGIKLSSRLNLGDPDRLTWIENFYAPASIDRGHMVFGPSILSVHKQLACIGRCLWKSKDEYISLFHRAEPHSSVACVADLRTEGSRFDPRLSQYSFQGLMKVIATGFILLSPLSVDSTIVMWESSQWLGKNIVPNTG